MAPAFYDRDAGGLPRRWLEMVAHSLRTLGPKAQATRMVRQYTTELYLPASASSRALAGHGDRPFAAAADLAAWKVRITSEWPAVRIELVETDDGEQLAGERLKVRAGIALGQLSPEDVRVEVLCGPAAADDEIADPVASELALESPPIDGSVAWYTGEAILGKPGTFGYTVRVLPWNPLLSAPAEMGLIALPIAPAGMVSGDLR